MQIFNLALSMQRRQMNKVGLEVELDVYFVDVEDNKIFIDIPDIIGWSESETCLMNFD